MKTSERVRVSAEAAITAAEELQRLLDDPAEYIDKPRLIEDARIALDNAKVSAKAAIDEL